MTTRHKLIAELEVKSGNETLNPKVEIVYDFIPEISDILFISARLIDGDGFNPLSAKLKYLAATWLYDDGYEAALTIAVNHRKEAKSSSQVSHDDGNGAAAGSENL